MRAVAIGAGIGGLSMAGVRARYFDRVDILERDHLPASVVPLAGTPRDRHPHALLSGALEAPNGHPTLQTYLADAGAIPMQMARHFRHERGDIGLFADVGSWHVGPLCAEASHRVRAATPDHGNGKRRLGAARKADVNASSLVHGMESIVDARRVAEPAMRLRG
jgi:hypothetical protein